MGGPGSGRKKGSGGKINGVTGRAKGKPSIPSKSKLGILIAFKRRKAAFLKAGEPDRVSKVNVGKRERFFTSVRGRGVKG